MAETATALRGARNIAVRDALAAAARWMTPEEVWERMPETSTGAVRRSLRHLHADLGLVERDGNKYCINDAGKTAEAVEAPETPVASAKPKNEWLEVHVDDEISYLSRDIAGLPDVNVLRMLRESGKRIFPLLYGPPGTGKTALARAAFVGEFVKISCDENTSPDDFLGQWNPDGDGGYIWSDGPLVTAMKNGHVLFVDDITLASPKTLAVMYPAMDGSDEITVKSHIVDGDAEVVKAQPGFFVVGAHNPGVHGAILTDALSSRFTFQVYVDTDLELARRLGVPHKFIKLAENLYTKQKNGLIGWAPQLRELLAAKDIAEVLDVATAVRNLIGIVPEEDVDQPLMEAITSVFGAKYERLSMDAKYERLSMERHTP